MDTCMSAEIVPNMSGTMCEELPGCETENKAGKKAAIDDVPQEHLTKILMYLRAVDMANSQISSRIFNQEAISKAIMTVISGSSRNAKTRNKITKLNTEAFRFWEIQHILTIINSSEPVRGGCLISKSWVKNFTKYAETISPEKKVLSRKKSRMLERKYSDVSPPWPEVNCEITCEHGNLRLSKGKPLVSGNSSPGKTSPPNFSRNGSGSRKKIETRLFRELQCYYPEAKLLKVKWGECKECQGHVDRQKRELEVVKAGRCQELEAMPALRELFGRRTGVPKHYTVRDSFPGGCPLTCGVYCLVPRSWLQKWRSFIKDPTVSRPRMPETGMLLCEGHGKLLAPPHVVEYLHGERRRLLGDLDENSGCVCEIVTTEEWEKIAEQYRCDFSVRFFVDSMDFSINWGVEQCYKCDPCYLGVYYMNDTARKLSH